MPATSPRLCAKRWTRSNGSFPFLRPLTLRVATRIFPLSGSDFFAEMQLPTLSLDLSDHAPGVQIRMVDMLVDHCHALDNHRLDLTLVPEMSFPE
jgi:hypothetical protein